MSLLTIAGSFNPVQATANVLELIKMALLISGLSCAIASLGRGKIGMAVGAVLVTLLLFSVMDSGQYAPLGREMARIMTLDGVTASSVRESLPGTAGNHGSVVSDAAMAVTNPGGQPGPGFRLRNQERGTVEIRKEGDMVCKPLEFGFLECKQ